MPSALLGAMFCLARPAATIAVIVLLSGFIGTLIAHAGIPAESLAQSLLLCLWIAVAICYATGRAKGRLWFWPGLAIPALYLLVTAVGILAAENTSAAFSGFKLGGWYMSAFLLLAIAPWPPATLRRAVRAIVVIAVAVGTYAVFRKIVGSSADELLLARQSTGVRASEQIRFFGSFLGPQQLAAWGAAALPFLLGLGLGWTGRWRWVAVLGLGLCAFAVLASDIRSGMVGGAAGMAFVFLLFQVARAFKGPRLAIGLTALVGVLALSLVGYFATVADSDSSTARLENLLSPGDDYAYQERTARWEQAIEDINRKPLGHGLGTVGTAGVLENSQNLAGPVNVDSSYLKVGLEQGWPILGLFVAGLLALLGGLARRTAATADPWRAALGIAGCGTLVSQIVLYYGSTYIEGIPALFAWVLIGLGAAPFVFVSAENDPDSDAA